MTPPSARPKLDAPKREVEFSLVIAASDPEGVYDKLARLREVGGYELVPRDRRRMLDQYFDTPDEKLQSRGFALRLRTVDGATAITLKGRARSNGKGEDRLEAERPFSLEGIDEVRARANLPALAPGDSKARDPAEILESALGVEPIQSRETLRLVRDVVRAGTKDVLAELALDRVHFEIAAGDGVAHYEVEVESKKPGLGPRAARAVVDGLMARYPDALLPWPYGKLATGKALEQLAASRGLDGLVTPGGVLTAPAYERIRKYFS